MLHLSVVQTCLTNMGTIDETLVRTLQQSIDSVPLLHSGGRGGGGGYHQGNSSSSMMNGPRRNIRNFHGDMSPDKRLEQRLFHLGDKHMTGINFDNYDKIPCEVSGKDIPLPIDVYTVETIGEDLFRNTQLCGYTRPTPVQKYSIPIGQRGRDLMACVQTGSGVCIQICKIDVVR